MLLLYLVLSSMISHMLLLSMCFSLMDIRPPFRKTFLCSLISMLFYVIPILTANILIQDPMAARVWIYRYLIIINPLSGLGVYLSIKPILKFSATRCGVIIYHQLLLSHLSSLVFLFLNETLAYILHMDICPDGFFILDYICNPLRILMQIMILIIVKLRLKKTGRYIIIPPNYTDKNETYNVIKIFIAVSVIYSVIVLFRTFLFPRVITPINVETGFIYLLLILAIIQYLSYTTSHFRNRLLNWEIEATGTYISSLLHTNQEFRAIKHDFYNVLQGYGGYLEIQDYEGLAAYHKKLFTATKQAGDFLSLIEVLRTRIAVYSLLEGMAKKAKESGISFSINQICEVTDIVLDDMDLCRVLGIVLDNAIEEAELSKDKQVNISFERKDKNTIVLVVSNTTGGDVNTRDIFQEGYTTKQNHSGIGLPQVLHILNSYEHCSLRVNYHDKQFTIFLILNAETRVGA